MAAGFQSEFKCELVASSQHGDSPCSKYTERLAGCVENGKVVRLVDV